MSQDSCDIQIRVRYSESDAMGYVHHARYALYFEMGRIELLRQCGLSYRELEAQGLFYVVVKLTVRYKRPARFDDLLTLTTSATRMTHVRIDHGYRLTRDGELLAEGESVIGLVGADGRPVRLPEGLYRQMAGLAAGAGGE